MNDKQFCENMKDTISEDLGLMPVDYTCKISNINAFFQINREGLENGKREKRLLMYRSLAKESIFIEYPGKESSLEYAKDGAGKIQNPYDFRPELHTKDNEIIAKLSLIDIVVALVEYSREQDKETMQKLAALIIKLAYMRGYKNKELEHPSYLIIVKGKKRTVMEEKKEDTLDRYFFPLSDEVKEYLNGWSNIRLPSRGYEKKISVSIEGFLYYLDILAQQEDCKYYYKKKAKGFETIDVGIGRINNLLTVVNVIDRLLCDRPYGDIVSGILKNVKPIRPDRIESVTGGLIKVVSREDSIKDMKIGTKDEL